MLEHTKGDWRWTGLIIEDSKGRDIATIGHLRFENDESEANAYLIAAAPKMAEALELMLEGSEIAPLQTDVPIRVWQRATPSEEAILYGFKALALSKAEVK